MIVVVVVLLVAVGLPALQQSREAARRTQSKNNLKQIGLALANYADSYRCYPAGGTFNSEGTGFHGWPTFLWCFMESTPYYSMVDFNQPWDSPDNAGFFRNNQAAYHNPSIENDGAKSAFPLSHYSANSNLLAANSLVKRSEIGELSNQFIAGELGGDFTPWGCPYNWRPLGSLTDTPRTYGRLENIGAHLLMADGSVRWVTPAVDAKILEAFRGPDLTSNAARGLKIVRPTSFPFPKDARIPSGMRMDHELYCFGFRNSRDELFELWVEQDKGDRAPNDADLKRIANNPHLVKLRAVGDFSDRGIAYLENLPLEQLTLSSLKITDEGLSVIRRLRSLRKLHLLRESVTPDLIEVVASLPNLEVLGLSVSQFSAEAADLLTPLSNRVELQLALRSKQFTDQNLSEVARVVGLRELRIFSDQVTDEGVLALEQLQQLSHLMLWGLQFSDDGKAAVQQRLPNCEIDLWRQAVEGTGQGRPLAIERQ